MLNGVGAPNGPRIQPFDRWFRYPAGFSATSLAECAAVIGAGPGSVIGDPFAGVGTTGVHAINLGASFIGIEVHPLIAELAALKFQPVECPRCLEQRAVHLTSNLVPADVEFEHSLVKRSFTPVALERLVAIREAVASLEHDPWHLHLKWCLLGALRDCASVKVGWPYQRPAVARVPRIADPERAFMRRVHSMASDLESMPQSFEGSIQLGDSRDPGVWALALGETLLDGVISSPPYLNNFDYADATRLELYFWGLARSWREMTTLVRADMVVASTQQCRNKTTLEAAQLLFEVCPVTAQEISGCQERLSDERRKRPRGKQYDLLLPSYFADLARVLANMRSYVVPGALITLVLGDSAPYGVYVDTPRLVATAAAEIGFTHLDTKQLRQRGLRWHSNGVRHSVGLAEQLILLRAPS